MIDITCMNQWTVYSSKIVSSQDVVKTLKMWEEDMNILGWKHKTFMEMVELVTY
jgi:hypothetical protein